MDDTSLIRLARGVRRFRLIGKALQILPLEDRRQQVRQLVGRTAKAGHAQVGQLLCQAVVEGWLAVVRDGQQRHRLDAVAEELFHLVHKLASWGLVS